jgi:hypothetical protein
MKTLIEMAREAGFTQPEGETWYEAFPQCIEAFAELVRADEREACAQLAEDTNRMVLALLNVTSQPKHIAAAIRARSNT